MAPAQKLGRNLLCPGGKRGKKRGEGGREGGKEKKRRTRALHLFFRHSSGRLLFEFPLKFDLNLTYESRNSPLLFLATLILSPWQSELLLFGIYSLLTSDTRIRVGFGCTIAKIPRPDRYFIYIWWYALNLVNINEDQNFCFRVLRNQMTTMRPSPPDCITLEIFYQQKCIRVQVFPYICVIVLESCQY